MRFTIFCLKRSSLSIKSLVNSTPNNLVIIIYNNNLPSSQPAHKEQNPSCWALKPEQTVERTYNFFIVYADPFCFLWHIYFIYIYIHNTSGKLPAFQEVNLPPLGFEPADTASTNLIHILNSISKIERSFKNGCANYFL